MGEPAAEALPALEATQVGVVVEGDFPEGSQAVIGIQGSPLSLGRGVADLPESGRVAVDMDFPGIDQAGQLTAEVQMPVGGLGGRLRIVQKAALGEWTTIKVTTPKPCGDCTPADTLPPDLIPVLDGMAMSAGESLGAESVRFDTTRKPGHVLMRLSTAALNQGEGPLHVVAISNTDDKSLVSQRLWTKDLDYLDVPAGRFVYHPQHQHVHVGNFERYDVVDPKTGEVVATSPKVSFCLRDSLRPMDSSTDFAQWGIVVPGSQCGWKEQAVNKEWADYYGAELYGQWVDVTDVPPGDYELRIVVDPKGIFVESDETNNEVSFGVTIPPSPGE
ncbi:MAG: lysyl oxidase family protein [Nocardioides sp.]